MSEWSQLYQDGADPRDSRRRGDRDFEALERERKERHAERRRARREAEEQEARAREKRGAWGSEWEREEAM